MCDTDPRPRTETPQAKIFLQGKNRPLYVTQPVVEIGLQMNAKDARLLNVTNLRDEQTLIPIGNVISVVEYLPEPITPDTQPDPDPVADPE